MSTAVAELKSTIPAINDPVLEVASKSITSSLCEHLTLAEKRHLLSKYGRQSSAYFTLQQEVKIFGDPRQGYIAYQPQTTPFGRVNIAFANPICAIYQTKALVQSFLKQIPGKSLFMGVDGDTANCLSTLGYRSNQMGTEFSFNLQDFKIQGKEKKHLRHAANLGKRHQLTIKELNWHNVDQQSVLHISESWRSQKAVNSRELKLLTRPPVFHDEWQVRKFYCFKGDKLLGYVFFDPYFKDGRIVGYCANILRKAPDAKPSDLLDYIILEAIKVFRQEGVEQLSLGISPLYNVNRETNDRPSIRYLQQFLFNYGNSLYAFKALAYHKTRYRANEHKWYFCSHDISTVKAVWAVLQGTHLIAPPMRPLAPYTRPLTRP